MRLGDAPQPGDRVRMARRLDGTGTGTVVDTTLRRGERLPVITVRMDTGGLVTRRAAYWIRLEKA